MRSLARPVLAGAMALMAASTAPAQIAVMTPLATWGGGDGWLAPGENAFLGTVNNERGIAYNPSTGNVLLVSRTGGISIRILNGLTGVETGTMDTATGGVITGGTFALSMIRVGGDGAIYGTNLTVQSTTSPFKMYRWANEAAAPTVAYTGDAGLPGARVGDDLAIIGSGAATRLAAGFSNNPVVAGNNGYAITDPTAGTTTAVGFAGTPPNAGDFRFGIVFTDATHVLGSPAAQLRYTDFAGALGTLVASPNLTTTNPLATAERLLAYAVIGGVPILAAQSNGDSHVSLYDLTDPANPVFITTGNATSGALTANGNGVGSLDWNITGPNTAILYAMSANQGIQAFSVTVNPVPEPSTLALAGLGVGGFLLRRLRRKAD